MCAPNVTRFLINTNVSLFTKSIYSLDCESINHSRQKRPFRRKFEKLSSLEYSHVYIYIDANKRGRALFKMIYLTEEREREKKMAEGKNSEGKNFER